MADPPLPPGFTLDEAPPPGFTLDAPTSDASEAPPAPDGSGFTDDQKQAILAYIPKAKDAADLERFAHEVSGGKNTIGNAQDVLDNFAKGNTGFHFTDPPAAQPKPQEQPGTLEQLRATIGDGILNGLDAVMPGLGSFLRDNRDAGKAFTEHAANAAVADYGPEVGGFIDTLLSPSGYGEFGDNLDRNVAHERAIMEGDGQDHPVASTAGELAGVGLTAPLAGRVAASIPIVAKAAEAAPKLTSAAKAAVGGAVYGSGAAGPDDRVGGAVTGAALGAATDVALPVVGRALFGKSGGKAANAEFADAAKRQNIDYMASDLPSAPKSKFATALSSLTFGGIPLAEQGEKNIATAAAAADRAVANVGAASDRTGAGQAAQRGARQFLDTTEAKMGALYDAVPIASDAPAAVSNTRAALTNLAESFQSNPKLAAAFQNPQIARFLDALTPQSTTEATGLLDAAGNPITRDVTHGGGLSWGDLKDFRTRVGKIIGQPGLATDGQQIGELRSLYAGLSDDMRATASDYGPAASKAFDRANTYARARSDRIDNVVSLILGPKNDKAPQSAFEALQRLGNEKGGDPLKLARALRSMPDDEANSVRATILDDLGDASPGRQNDKGNVFSPSEWLTGWNKLSDRAKNVLFTGEHRKALDDLALVFSGMKSSSKFANNSKTGLFVAAAHTSALGFAHPVLGMMDAALQYAGGKLLANPGFAKKLAGTPMNEAGARAYWSRPWVKGIAAKNPAIAGEIQAFQKAFLGANDNSGIVSSAAASPDSNSQDQQQ